MYRQKGKFPWEHHAVWNGKQKHTSRKSLCPVSVVSAAFLVKSFCHLKVNLFTQWKSLCVTELERLGRGKKKANGWRWKGTLPRMNMSVNAKRPLKNKTKGGAVVETLASQQCGRLRCHMWVEFVAGGPPCSAKFFLRVRLRFPPLLKNQHFQIPIRPGTHGHMRVLLRTPKCSVVTQITTWKQNYNYKNTYHKAMFTTCPLLKPCRRYIKTKYKVTVFLTSLKRYEVP